MAEWTYKLNIDMLERKGTSACLMATRAMIARIRELEAELERASQPGGGDDTARLDFMIEQQCWIQWTNRDGSILQCQVYHQNEDEEYFVLSGEDRYFNTPREALDAARASLDGRREG